jgi:hypothetical protein
LKTIAERVTPDGDRVEVRARWFFLPLAYLLGKLQVHFGFFSARACHLLGRYGVAIVVRKA